MKNYPPRPFTTNFLPVLNFSRVLFMALLPILFLSPLNGAIQLGDAAQALAVTKLAAEVSGPDLFSGQEISLKAEGKRALVVVFLSALCPCSDSHMKELTALSKEYPDFKFVGVHSNTDEGKDVAKAYFQRAQLPFPVIQDGHAQLADQYRALKTPHAFIVLGDGSVVYKGGVSSSRNFANADRKYLREALNDVENGRAVKTPEARTLGCAIARGGKNAL